MPRSIAATNEIGMGRVRAMHVLPGRGDYRNANTILGRAVPFARR
jgi:hypothetical protein